MTIFDIKRYSINDGPGIRTTLFFKGCPLHCVWCHNPESWSAKIQKTYKKSKCIGCRTCVEACPQGAIQLTADGIQPVAGVRCLQCGRCAENCPTTALEMCGREWTEEELLAEIEKERDIMLDSGGGVTLCGGEPLYATSPTAQAEVLSLLRACGQRGFHRAVDTTLHVPDTAFLRQVADECELFLVDIKHMDSVRHQQLTGVGNELILENLKRLSSWNTSIWIRIPLIEGINTDDENIEQTARFVASLPHDKSDEGILQVNLLPYHDVGKDKHRRLWSTYNPQHLPMFPPSEETLQRCATHFETHGIKTIIGG